MKTVPWHVVEWAADECERQRSGEQSVVWMLRGWEWASETGDPVVNRADLLHLAHLVEPRVNDGQTFRRVGVRVGFNVKMPWEQVDRAIANLLASELDPDEWFREYEEIHPLRDGNGRTGSILWNWFRHTLDRPEAPPDFWSQLSGEEIVDRIEAMARARSVRSKRRAHTTEESA